MHNQKNPASKKNHNDSPKTENNQIENNKSAQTQHTYTT